MSVRIIVADCRQIMAAMEPESVSAVVTDPPYLIEFMGREWDAPGHMPGHMRAMFNRNPGEVKSEGYRQGIGRGPEMQAWHESWAREAFRVLRPGGHLVAFGGTRTYHRLTCAIEDAGFEIRDTLCWLHGQGFPKSLDVGKAIDKQRDDHTDVVAVTRWTNAAVKRSGVRYADILTHFGFNEGSGQIGHWTALSEGAQPAVPTWDQWIALKSLLGFGDEMDAEVWRLNGRKGKPGDGWEAREVTGRHDLPAFKTTNHEWREPGERRDIPATDLARRWDGWGTALKPAHEPILLCRKPLAGTVAANVARFGTGALSINATRIVSSTTDTFLDRVRGIASDVAYNLGESTADISPLPNEALIVRNLDTILSALLGGSSSPAPSEAGSAPRSQEPLDSLAGCPACHRLGDGLSRLLQVGGLIAVPSPGYAHTHSHPSTPARAGTSSTLHNHSNGCIDLRATPDSSLGPECPDGPQNETGQESVGVSERLEWLLGCTHACVPGWSCSPDQRRTLAQWLALRTQKTVSVVGNSGGDSPRLPSAFDIDAVPIIVTNLWQKIEIRLREKGRFPSNCVLSHVPPDAHGNGGCREVGVKRVKTGMAVRHRGVAESNLYGKGMGALPPGTPDLGYADPDGTELVSAWECVEGFSGLVPCYEGSFGVLTPLDEPAFLLDRLASLLQVARGYSMTCSIPSPRAAWFDGTERTRSAASLGGLSDGVARALGVKALLDSQPGYPSCRRFCGERARLIAGAAQAGLPSLLDALDRVHSDLSRLVRSHYCQPHDLPSNSDDALASSTDAGTPRNRSAADDRPLPVSPGPLFRTSDTERLAPLHSAPRDSTDACNTGEGEAPQTSLDNAGTSAAVRLLVLACADLAWRFLPASLIQRSENYTILPSCPIFELDRQSGERKGDPPNRKRRRSSVGAMGYGSNTREFEGDGYADTGGASRFFLNVAPDSPDAEATRNLILNGQAGIIGAWESEDQNRNDQTDCTSPERDTFGDTSTDASNLPMSLSGSGPTVPSPMDTKSTTSTGTNRTTTSQTSNSSVTPTTSGSTPGASAAMASGGSRAASADRSSPSTPTTGTSVPGDTPSTDGADPATSARSLPINSGDVPRMQYRAKASRRERNAGLGGPDGVSVNAHPT
jgi:DNA methylase